MDTALHDRLIAQFEPVLASHGYELVEVEFVPGAGGGTLRIYIDSPEGIDVEDCSDASHVLSELLDADDPIPSAYSLEVSSPGLDRPLKRPQDFARFVGERVQVKARLPLNGRRRFVGKLQNVGEVGIELDIDGELVSIAFADIDKTRLVPNI